MIGVIICVSSDITVGVATELRHQLSLRFPGVEIAVVPAVHALAFEYETTPPPAVVLEPEP